MGRISLAILVALAACATAVVGSSSAATKVHAGHAFADATVQVEENFSIHTPNPQILGVAHIQIHAFDVDPTHPQSSFQQQDDQVSFSCTAVSGDNPCVAFPQGNVKFADQVADNDVAISADGGFTFLSLVDGGTPGNAAVGTGTTPAGGTATKDSITWAQPGSGRSWTGYLLAGNVNINY
jgi:hypothetical protein